MEKEIREYLDIIKFRQEVILICLFLLAIIIFLK
jgi:hypothetical protein